MGVKFSQIDEVRGYADTRLRNDNDPFDASNRRISLLVKFEEAAIP
jgi:flagellar motor protein MotB